MPTILPESKHRGQYILVSPAKQPSNIIIIIHIGLCVSSYYLTIVSDCRLPFCLLINGTLFRSHDIAVRKRANNHNELLHKVAAMGDRTSHVPCIHGQIRDGSYCEYIL